MPDARLRSPLLTLAAMDADRERVESTIHEAVRNSDPYLTEIASHLVVAGGKRLRPVVALAAAQVAGTPASHDVVRGGVACELVHLGSLYHDDVIDESDTRRGVETVNAKWGNLQAILAGDFLLSRASEIAASLGTEVAGLLARTIGWLCEGEIEQLRYTYDVARTEQSYLVSIHGKTASLFGTAARIGGIVAGLERELIDDLTEWGNAFGMVFQIVDDILDITDTTEQLGKPAGHDLVDGRLHAARAAHAGPRPHRGGGARRPSRPAARHRRARQGPRHRARPRRGGECHRLRPSVRRRRRGGLRRSPVEPGDRGPAGRPGRAPPRSRRHRLRIIRGFAARTGRSKPSGATKTSDGDQALGARRTRAAAAL